MKQSDPNHDIPDYLIKTQEAIKDAGFSAKAYAGEYFGTGLQKIRSQGIQVQISKDEPRIDWYRGSTDVTEFVNGQAGGASRVPSCSPTGFEFNILDDGDFQVGARLDNSAEAEEFTQCFTKPKGPNGKITGPLTKSPDQREREREQSQTQLNPVKVPNIPKRRPLTFHLATVNKFE